MINIICNASLWTALNRCASLPALTGGKSGINATLQSVPRHQLKLRERRRLAGESDRLFSGPFRGDNPLFMPEELPKLLQPHCLGMIVSKADVYCARQGVLRIEI